MYPANAALNAIIWLPAAVGPQTLKGVDLRDGVSACVTGMRKSLGRLRDPSFVRGEVTEAAKALSQAAWDNNCLDLVTVEEGCLVVNSTWK